MCMLCTSGIVESGCSLESLHQGSKTLMAPFGMGPL
jgi:hypothetical protein